MQTNEFEKSVKEQLDNLKISPGDKVWEEVSARIQTKEKRRSPILFWMILLTLIIGGGGYFFYTKNEDNTHYAGENRAVTNSNNAQRESDDENEVDNTGDTNSMPFDSNKEPSTKVEESIKSSPQKEIVEAQHKTTQQFKISTTKARLATAKAFNISANKNGERAAVANDQSPENLSAEPSVVPENKVTHGELKTNLAVENSVENNNLKSEVKEQESGEHGKTDSTNKSTSGKARKWSWGVSFGLGLSQIHTPNSAASSYQSAVVLSGNFNSPQSAAFAKRYNLAPAANIGVFAERALGQRLSLSLGLKYQYYGTIAKTGDFVNATTSLYDSVSMTSITVPSLYRPGYTSRYVTSSHSLQIPINAHYQVNKNPQKPIKWYLGVAPGVVVSSNVLHYDSQYRAFYKDKTLQSNWQLMTQTGVMFPVIQNQKLRVEFGPELQYQLNNIFKTSTGEKDRFFSFGISGKIYLNK